MTLAYHSSMSMTILCYRWWDSKIFQSSTTSIISIIWVNDLCTNTFTGIAILFWAQGKQLGPSMHAADSSQDSIEDSQVWTITVQISLTLEMISATINLKKLWPEKEISNQSSK